MALVEFIHRPGTDHGPCTFPCLHDGCRDLRRAAEARCVVCRKAIGYDTSFRRTKDEQPFHAECVESMAPSALADEVLSGQEG